MFSSHDRFLKLIRLLTSALLCLGLAGVPAGAKSIQTLTARPSLPPGREAPLCILLPGGAGRMPEATGVMSTLGNPLAERGWIVVVPISPDGASFFGDAADEVISVMNRYESDPDVRPGRVLLAGISNGGISALQVASMVPDRVSGVIAVPGMLHDEVHLRRLKNLPVYLRVGATDHLRWAEQYPTMVRALERADVRLDAKLLQDVGHGIPIDWNEIDTWIADELGAMAPTITRRETTIALPSQAIKLRRWTSRNGATVEAALAEIHESHVILLRRGKPKLKILRANLSAADQAYLATVIQAAHTR